LGDHYTASFAILGKTVSEIRKSWSCIKPIKLDRLTQMNEVTNQDVKNSTATLSVDDPEMLVHAIRNARLQPCRISNRPAQSEIARITFPTACLDFAKFGAPLLFTGSMPDDSFTIVFVLECPEPGHNFYFSASHTDGYIGFFPPGGIVDAFTPRGYSNAVLTIPTDEFYAAISIHFPEMPDKILKNGAAIRVPEKEQSVLRSLLSEVKATLQKRPESFVEVGLLVEAERRLIAAFLGTLREGLVHLVPRSSGTPQRREENFRDARDFINTHLSQPLRTSDICRALEISERSLENLFHDHIGLSPSQYIRHQRLHRARRLLVHAPSRPGIVKEVALDLGFRHLGRFSVYYSEFFGENPSETASNSVKS